MFSKSMKSASRGSSAMGATLSRPNARAAVGRALARWSHEALLDKLPHHANEARVARDRLHPKELDTDLIRKSFRLGIQVVHDLQVLGNEADGRDHDVPAAVPRE